MRGGPPSIDTTQLSIDTVYAKSPWHSATSTWLRYSEPFDKRDEALRIMAPTASRPTDALRASRGQVDTSHPPDLFGRVLNSKESGCGAGQAATWPRPHTARSCRDGWPRRV